MCFWNLLRVVLSCGVLVPTVAAALQAPEVVFRVDTFGLNAAALSVRGSPELFSAAVADDRATFTLHMTEGVFIDRSALGRPAHAVVGSVSQLRGPTGVDLVVSLRAGTAVTSAKIAEGVRYIFAADPRPAESGQAGAAGPRAGIDCAAEQGKILELQALVRDLTLKVVELEQKAQRSGAAEVRGEQGAH